MPASPTLPAPADSTGLHRAIRRLCTAISQIHTAADIKQVLTALREGLHDTGIHHNECVLNLVDAHTDPPVVTGYSLDDAGSAVAVQHPPAGRDLLLLLWDRQEVAYRPDRPRQNEHGESDSGPRRSMVDVPFSHGTLSANSLEPDAFSPDQIEIMQTLAATLSIGFQRLRDLDDMLARQRELEEHLEQIRDHEILARAVHHIGDQVGAMKGPTDIAVVVEAVRNGLLELGIDFDYCDTNLVLPEFPAGHIRVFCVAHEGQMYDRGVVPGSLTIRFMQDGIIAYRPDLEAEDLHGEAEDLRRVYGAGVRCVLDVPFSHGTLAINSALPDAFSQRDIRSLERLAQALSAGFHRLDDLRTLESQQEQLRQFQKMEAIGKLAAGIAHDFNNLLTVINGYSRTLAERLPQDHPLHSHALQIRQAGTRAAATIDQLLALGRRQVLRPADVDLNSVMTDTVHLLEHLIGEQVVLEVDLDPAPCAVHADAAQLEQVIVNLAVNARDAMPDGGTLRLETRHVHLAETVPSADPPVVPGDYVRLTVADTGRGMDSGAQVHAFEPFFTTKGTGEGRGLGLSTVYGIVTQRRGHIELRSEPGRGTAVTIHFAKASETPIGSAQVDNDTDSPPRGAGESLLVVEDEELLLDLAVHILADAGYRPCGAADAAAAIALVAEGGAFQLLLTDLIMPGMDGRELAQRLRQELPEMSVIYMSGYVNQAPADERGLAPGTPLLNKPFSPQALLHLVADALHGPQAARED